MDDQTEQETIAEIKDSQTVIVRDTKQIILNGVPLALFERYKEFCRKYAKGNWTVGLQLVVDAAEMVRLVTPIVEQTDSRFAEVNERLTALEERIEESEKKPVKKELKTFSGGND